MAIVYLLTNRLNGKQYVGKTVQSLDVRWGGHVGSARRGDNGMLVCRAIKKYGIEAFDKRVLEECDESVLGAREVHWIAELGTHVLRGGYNLTLGGDGGLPGYEFSEESREKIRRKATGRRHTEATKAKMRAAKLGRKQSPEVIEARRQKLIGQKRTEEQRVRISESLKGHAVSDVTRKRIGEANRHRVVTEATKKKFYKAVEQLTPEGTLITIHQSLTAAAHVAGLSKGAMSGVVRQQKTYGGFSWRYSKGV